MRTVKSREGWITPLRPNWNRQVQQELDFLTDVIVSRNEQEQRFALRQTPRINYQFQVAVAADRLNRVVADISGRQNDIFWWPLDWRTAVITSGASAGADAFSLTSVPFWLRAGASIIIQTETTEELALVDDVTTGTVTLAEGLAYHAPTGAKIREARAVRFPNEVEFRQTTSKVWEATVRLSEVPAVNIFSAPAISPGQHLETDLFEPTPDWSDAPRLKIGRTRELFDPMMGRDSIFSATDFFRRETEFSVFERTTPDMEELIAFFARQFGQRGSFWSPDLTRQLRVVGHSGNLVDVAGEDAFHGYGELNVLKWMVARWTDGSQQINEVTEIALDGFGDTRLTFANSWTNPVTEFTRLHWLPLRRFSSDKITVEWLTTTKAKVKLPMVTLKTEEVDP